MLFRPAQLSDLDRLCELELQAYGPLEATPRRILEGLLKNEEKYQKLKCTVLERDGVVLGFVVMEHLEDKNFAADLVIAPEEQGQGYGRSLFERVIEPDKLHWLAVKVTNLKARALYEKLGFRPLKEVSEFYKDGSAGLLMERAAGAGLGDNSRSSIESE